MDGSSSYSTSSSTLLSSKQDTFDPRDGSHGIKKRYNVVVLGAGASGLCCAHELLKQNTTMPNGISVLVLEARDRIGGRIHSVPQEKTSVKKDGTTPDTPATFVLDNGAAWIHGTGFDWPQNASEITQEEQDKDEKKCVDFVPYENPMMSLLHRQTPPGQDVCMTHLNPIFELGNPWMRPQTVVHIPGNMVLYVNGQRLPSSSPIIEKAVNRHFEIMNDVSQVGENMFDTGNGMDTANSSLEQIVHQITNTKPKYNRRKKKTKSQQEKEILIDTIVPFYRHLIECWYACPANEMPLYNFVESSSSDSSCSRSSDDSSEWDEYYVSDGDFYGPHCTIRNGMATVLEPLLEDGVKDCIRCNQEVVSIRDEKEEGCVSIKTRAGLEVQADCCVVTMSVGCLQHAVNINTMFDPPLSQDKREAIFARRMGGYKKVLLTFDRIFWPRNEPFVGLIRNLSNTEQSGEKGLGNYLLLDNLWARDGIPCFEAVLFGDAVTWAAHKSDEEIKAEVLNFIAETIGRDKENQVVTILGLHEWCVDCHVTRWEEDPFSRGAYSSYQIGTLERHAQELGKSDWNGKLFFAGEADNPEHEGSVHGALFSGMQTADTVRTQLSNRQSKQG